VNLHGKVIEVYSNPVGGKYTVEKIASSGEALQLPGGLSGSVTPEDILGDIVPTNQNL